MPALLLAVFSQFGPEALSPNLGTVGALQYVISGMESACLWVAVMLLIKPSPYAWAARCACLWSATEHAMRAACRPAFSMFQPAPKVNLCDAATGLNTSALAVVVALCLAWGVQYVEARHGHT